MYVRDQSRKEIAIRIIQKFAKNKLSSIFSWKRVMKSIDVKETHKLSNSLLYQASQPTKKPAMLDDDDGATSGQDKDNTFMTTGGSGSPGSGVVYPRRVSKAGLDELTPELARLQQVMNVETEEVVEEKRVARKHFADRRGSRDYFNSTFTLARPLTAPAQEIQQENEMDALDLKNMTRHQRRTMLTSASTSSMHAVNAARNLLRGPSTANLMQQNTERPKSADINLNFSCNDNDDEDGEDVKEFEDDKDIELVEQNIQETSHFSPKKSTGKISDMSNFLARPKLSSSFADPKQHRILGRFEPKKQSKRERFNKIIRRLVLAIS
jgi:hypothetical protein